MALPHAGLWPRSRLALSSLVVGLGSAALSLWRLWLGNDAALGETLWAEDGLFPLCVDKAGFATCLTEPFAGYWLFLPRLMAGPISVAPVELWAWTANLLAAVLVGAVSAFTFVIARRRGLSSFASAAIALLPAITPMVGLEAINAIGSSYMLLLYLATLAVVLYPAREWKRPGAVLVGLLLLVTAMTIPSAIVLAFPLGVQAVRGVIGRRRSIMWAVALTAGLVGQALVAINATSRRPVNLGIESLNNWANSVPVSLLTYWPGVSLGEYSFFTNFSLSPLGITGWLVVCAIVAVGSWQLWGGWHSVTGNRSEIGQLLLAGLALGLIPSVIGYTNNRYFVVPLLLWGAAALVWLDPVIRRSRPWVVGVLAALVLLIWWPAMPASEYRSTPAPPWTAEVERIKAKCLSDPAFVDRPLFTPFWPPNWGDGLDEPTHPNLPCTTVFRWLG